MGIVYDTSSASGKFSGNFNPYNFDAVEQFEKHYSNLLYLDFFASNPGATFSEKKQAEAEIIIAKRKMKYWEKYAKAQGNLAMLQGVMKKAKKQWNR